MKNKLIEKIEHKGYTFVEDKDLKGTSNLHGLWLLSPNSNKKTLLFLGDKTIYLAHGVENVKEKDMNEIEELVEAGTIIKATGKEIYRAYYNDLSDEEFEEKYLGYSLRAKRRIDEERQLLHHIESKHGWDVESFPGDSETIAMFINASDVEIGLLEDENKWCAQYSYRVGIDDHCVVRHYFSKKPTKKIIQKLIDLLKIQEDLELNRLDESYRCWECGCNVESWLDLDEDIYECARMARDHYCGC